MESVEKGGGEGRREEDCERERQGQGPALYGDQPNRQEAKARSDRHGVQQCRKSWTAVSVQCSAVRSAA
jgi:hypothetical protein